MAARTRCASTTRAATRRCCSWWSSSWRRARRQRGELARRRAVSVSAPLRILGKPAGPTVGAYSGPVDPWLTRLVKLVPAEVVAVYLAGRPLAEAQYAGEWPVVCL